MQPLQPPVTGRLQTWGPTTRRVSGRTAPWPTSAPSSPRTTSPNPVTLRARHSWPGAYGAAHRAGHLHGIAGQRGVRVLRHRTGQQPAPAQIQRRGHYEESDRPYIPCFSSWLPAGYLPAHSLMTPSSSDHGSAPPWNSTRLYGCAARATSVHGSQVESSGFGLHCRAAEPRGRKGSTSNSQGTGRCV